MRVLYGSREAVLSHGKLAAGVTRRVLTALSRGLDERGVGFDYLRDESALDTKDLVQRSLETALIDEADSILLDEARIPLVVAGGNVSPNAGARRMADVVRQLERRREYTLDPHGRNVGITDLGIRNAEIAAGC